jgi:integrase
MKSIIFGALAKFSPKNMLVDRWIESYLQIVDCRPCKDTTKNAHRILVGHISKELGRMPMSSVQPIHIVKLVKGIWDSGRHQTARSVGMELRSLFNEAVCSGVLMSNPTDPVRLLPARVRRSRLSIEVWIKMIEAAKRRKARWVVPLLHLALVTGQRRGDLVKMRFDDVWDNHLHIEQEKTGERIALPIDLRLDVIGMSISDAIEECREYRSAGPTMVRGSNGKALSKCSLSCGFHRVLMDALCNQWEGPRTPPSLHECRSLAEREYYEQGINTMTLLGHKRPSMTWIYHDDRGINKTKWRTLRIT